MIGISKLCTIILYYFFITSSFILQNTITTHIFYLNIYIYINNNNIIIYIKIQFYNCMPFLLTYFFDKLHHCFLFSSFPDINRLGFIELKMFTTDITGYNYQVKQLKERNNRFNSILTLFTLYFTVCIQLHNMIIHFI